MDGTGKIIRSKGSASSLESVLLALAAGLVGVGCAWLLQGSRFGMTAATLLTETVYGLHLNPLVALGCVAFAVLMGYAGGFLLAFRASRMSIVQATFVHPEPSLPWMRAPLSDGGEYT